MFCICFVLIENILAINSKGGGVPPHHLSRICKVSEFGWARSEFCSRKWWDNPQNSTIGAFEYEKNKYCHKCM